MNGGQSRGLDRRHRRLDLVSAALKSDSLPERALLRAIDPLNRLILSQAAEDEYREVIFRPKFDRFVSVTGASKFSTLSSSQPADRAE